MCTRPPSAVHALPGLDQPFSATLGVWEGEDNVRTPVRMLLPCGQSLDRWPVFVTVSSCVVDDPKYMCAGTGNNVVCSTLLCVVLELHAAVAGADVESEPVRTVLMMCMCIGCLSAQRANVSCGY